MPLDGLGPRGRLSSARSEERVPLIDRYLQIDDEVLLLEVAKAGMGLATLPCFYADPAPELVRVSSRDREPVLGIWLLTHPDLTRNARVRCFIDFFAEVLKGKQDRLSGGR